MTIADTPTLVTSLQFRQLLHRSEAASFIKLVVVFVHFTVPGVPGWSSFLNLMAEVGILALPVRLLMIAGQFDVAIGAEVPAAALTVGIVIGHNGHPEVVGIASGLCVGLLIGITTGYLVTGATIPSPIITIASMFAVIKLSLGFTNLLNCSTSAAVGRTTLPGLLLKTVANPTARFGLRQWPRRISRPISNEFEARPG